MGFYGEACMKAREMIQKLRIDDRLLHGQVAFSWKSALGYDAIVIASDEAAGDSLRKATIQMCCPPGVKLATRSVADAAVLLKNPKLEKMKVFVICASPQAAYTLLGMIEERPCINLGGMQSAEGKRMFSKAVYVDEEDLRYLDQIDAQGYCIEVQEVPSTAVHDFKALRAKI